MWTEGAVELPVRWRKEDRRKLKKKYQIGQKIRIIKTEIEPATPVEKRKKVFCTEEWEVVEKHKYHLLCKNEKGTRESFGYFELEQIAVQQERPVGRRMWWNKG